MLTIICSIILLVVGIIFLLLYNKYDYDYLMGIAVICLSFGALSISVCIISLIIKPFEYINFKTSYDTYKETLTYSNDIRDATITQDIIYINTEIKLAKTYRDNKWIGIFIPYEKGNLELLKKE